MDHLSRLNSTRHSKNYNHPKYQENAKLAAFNNAHRTPIRLAAAATLSTYGAESTNI